MVPTMEALLSYCQADIRAKNEQGITPLFIALASGNDENAAFLVERGNDEDRSVILTGNVTAYHIAADMNLVHTLRALLSADENKSTENKDERGSSSDQHSKTQEDAEMPKTISEMCCTTKNDRGETPLDLAVLSGHVQCCMLLLPKDHLGRTDEAEATIFMEERRKELKKLQHQSMNSQEEKKTPRGATTATGTNGNADIETKAKMEADRVSKMEVSADQKETGVNHKKMGNDHFLKHNYVEAIEEYTKAVQADPTDATYYSNRSACNMALKRHEKALYDAVICRYLKPDWTKGCYRMAVARLALGRYEDAALSAWEGVQLDNENDELKCLLQKTVKLGKKEHNENMSKQKLHNENTQEETEDR